MAFQDGTVYVFRNLSSGTVLAGDSPSYSWTHYVVGWERHDGMAQQWVVETSTSEEIYLRNVGHSEYLNIYGEPRNGALAVGASRPRAWQAIFDGTHCRLIYPGTSLCLDLDSGQTGNGTTISLQTYDQKPHQHWDPELLGSPVGDNLLKLGLPYVIQTMKDSSSAELGGDDKSVIPNSRSPQRQGQQWTLERASPGQFYIKSHLNTYLNVDGPWRNCMRVIASPNRQAWNIRLHSAASNTFRIFYPGTNSAVGLDRRYTNPGSIHLWGSNGWNSEQLWTFGLASEWNRFSFDNRPYLIVNREAGTAIGPSDDQKSVIGFPITPHALNLEWMFEATGSLYFIKSMSTHTYLGVEGDAKQGAKIICSNFPGAGVWTVKAADTRHPTSTISRIFWSDTNLVIGFGGSSVQGDTPGMVQDPETHNQTSNTSINSLQLCPNQVDSGPDYRLWVFR